MSYEKQTWANGDVITAEKLNHIEDGVASASGEEYVVTFTEISGSSGGAFTSDKTATEAKAAYDAGQKVVGVISGQDYLGVALDCYDAGEDSEVPYLWFKGWGPVGSGEGFNAFKFYRIQIYDYESETYVEANMTSIS